MNLLQIILITFAAVFLSACCCLQQCCCPAPENTYEAAQQAPVKGDGDTKDDAGKQLAQPQTPNATRTPPRGSTQTTWVEVTNYAREGYLSCWSTSAEIIMQSVGNVRNRQCRQANHVWYPHHSDACDSSEQLIAGSASDTDGYPDFPYWNFLIETPTATALSQQAAKDEINDGHPFAFSRTEVGNGVKHMMVARGYSVDTANQLWLCVMDPQGFRVPCTTWAIRYADYAGSSAYDHDVTYYGIKK